MDPNAPTEPATGATPPAEPAEPAKPEPAKDSDGLGEAGKKALAEERAARKALEQQLKALEPLKALASALDVKPDQGKTDVQTLTEQIEQLRKAQADSELRALRLEVAAEKGLTPAQAARLSGSSREDLAKDADELKALFPASNGTGTPKPDPTQGARSGAGELEAALKAAQAKGDAKESIRIKQLIAAQKSK